MNIFQKVILKYLKKNKVRTFATIVGILLSSAMVCAVTTFLSSMDHYVAENAIFNTGDWHAGMINVDWETCENLASKEEVTDIVLAQRIGYAKITQCEYEYKSYYYLLGVKNEFLDTMCAHITSGRFPREQYEVLLPESLYEISGVKYEIGDKMVLETGKRMYRSTVLWQDDPYTFFTTETNREWFSREKSRLYTVVGFYDDLSYKIESASAPGYTVFTYFEEEPLWKESYDYDVYFNIENGRQVYNFAEKNGFTPENDITTTFNTEVVGVAGILQNDGSQSTVIFIVGFVLCLIIIGSIALIYNMFSISVSERTKQFALLSSVGATQKQIQGMVLFESLFVSIVGIPFGIVTGIGGIWIALKFIGDNFEALGFSIPMTIHVSVGAVIGAVVISLVTVFVSAWIPSRRAMQATIIETIRQNKDIYQAQEQEKAYVWPEKMFGISGVLAEQYCHRSPGKYKATLLSLFVSCILFVLVSFFMDTMLRAVENVFDENSFDLAFYFDETQLTEYSKDEFFELLESEEHITDAVYTTSTKSYRAEMDKQYLSDWALENIGTMTKSYRLKPEMVTLNVNVTFVQDEAFLELLKKYKLDEEEYMNMENPKAIVVDGVLNSNTNTSVNLLGGDTCIVSFSRAVWDVKTYEDGGQSEYISQKHIFTLEGGKTIYERPYYLDGEDGLLFLYPERLRQYYIGRFTEKGTSMKPVKIYNDFSYLVNDNICNCKFLSNDYNASYEAMCQMAADNQLSTNNFVNNANQIEKEKSLIQIIRVLSYGFMVLISLVAAINVFNTISTSIRLRRREFAVLKSIGMTESGIGRMILAESILVSGKALLYGLPVSMIGTLLIHLIVSVKYSISYRFPLTAMGISVISIFIIVSISVVHLMRKRKTENVLETLRNENI